MMRNTGSIITGSLAYRFIQRDTEPWRPGDICIVTTFGSYHRVTRFLKAMFPAARVRHWDPPSGALRTSIFPYHGSTSMEATDFRVRIFQTRTHDVFYPLPFFTSTHLMNALTSDALVSAYPDLTFHQKGIYTNHAEFFTLRSTDHTSEELLDRDFQFFEDAKDASSLAAACRSYGACAKVDRFLGDRWTLVLPVGLESVREAAGVLESREVTAWRIGGSPCDNDHCFGFSSRSLITTLSWVENRPTGVFV